jgi:uncharacterized LabA/DUF88 family protein
MSNQRVSVYIDGFNLYYGLKQSGKKSSYWVDLQALARSLVGHARTLAEVKYFTSRVAGNAGSKKRQSTYLDALGAVGGLDIFYGNFLASKRKCRNCGNEHEIHQEKMTDVNIAVEMLKDAFQDRYDIALLVSADSDLISPISTIRQLFPKKHITAVFPPNRQSNALKQCAHGVYFLSINAILKLQLPYTQPAELP